MGLFDLLRVPSAVVKDVLGVERDDGSHTGNAIDDIFNS